ncbi:HEPN domain-containing protein [Salinivibrio sp. YCSC6]|uniref:HEPN domain-containing protein n=1 Tax=Salinivibrio sp. YCSC6 TaxID=2003370 RepID=UPI000BBBD189|nr:HEPN domain-containing protein [Salinivibrio sp. YCSC6]PCE67553.1 hypothetical protein B6G00_04185 [Salinivibrio sp. YCSC6]QCF35540.1 hypothetical protein E8E00_04765 [Salinivibrio sp. YCSC6]
MIAAGDLLVHARSLYESAGDEEVVLRNVARNSYYALFHSLNSLDLKSVPVLERSRGTHEQLIQQLRASDQEHLRQLGLQLAKLKPIRVKADYHLDKKFSDHDARSTMLRVEKVLREKLQPAFDKDCNVEDNSGSDTIKEGSSEPAEEPRLNKPPNLSVVK